MNTRLRRALCFSKFSPQCLTQYIFISYFISMLQMVNVIMLNIVIPGFWFNYSKATAALFTGDEKSWTWHSDLVFPKTAKCFFTPTGPSGSIQILDSLCLLPLNVLNQKMFVIVWMWYILQLIVSIINFVYWMIIYYSKNIRIMILRRHSMMAVSRKQIMQATNKGHLGNFFVLNQIAKNTNATTFIELMSDLSLSVNCNQDTLPSGSKTV